MQVLQCVFDLGRHAAVTFAGRDIKSVRRRCPPNHLVRVDGRHAEQLPVSQSQAEFQQLPRRVDGNTGASSSC